MGVQTLTTNRKTSESRDTLAARKDDFYETPREATTALVTHVCLPDRIWEPACGRGAISELLLTAGYEVHCTDLVDYGYERAQAGIDFLMETRAPAGFDAIVTNPPYKLAAAFAVHALRLCPKAYMLLRLGFLEGGAKDLDRRQALDGGALAKVLVFANRLPRMHRDGWQGKKTTSRLAFAWFCWDRAHQGPTVLERIRWTEEMRSAA